MLAILESIVLYNLKYEKLLGALNELSVGRNITKADVDVFIVYFILFVIVWCKPNDQSTLGQADIHEDPEFKKKTFAELNDMFCKHLRTNLEERLTELYTVNYESGQRKTPYIPIATTIEMTKGKTAKRYDNMLKCLKKNRRKALCDINTIIQKLKYSPIGKNRVIEKIICSLEPMTDKKNIYLVLGDPGSGKTVSLIELCLELLKETRSSGRTPVYISLKNWVGNEKPWSNSHLPQEKDLLEYIKNEVYSNGNPYTDEFLNLYYDKMMEHGRWYFIFDSFDELPCLMNGDNHVVKASISKLLHNFLSKPFQSGGIIASRKYNQPEDSSLKQAYKLTIQNLNVKKIRAMVKSYIGKNADDIVKPLFKEHPDLVYLCGNPLHLSLLIEYWQTNHQRFPLNQYDLFDSHFSDNIRKNEPIIREKGLTDDDVKKTAMNLAISMQVGKHPGLDYPVATFLTDQCDVEKEKLEECLSVLVDIGLCRISKNKKIVSFAHRRFQEFFYANAIINKVITVDEDDYVGILKNTGTRDALVLYCQIGEKEEINNIISFCCKAIEDNLNSINSIRNKGCVDFVNAVYFLTEAFCYKKEMLDEWAELIASLEKYLVPETDYIVQLAIVNSMLLLPSNDIQKMVIKVLALDNRWLNRIIISNCQVIQKLDRKEESAFCIYFDQIGEAKLFKTYFSMDFSLSLSDCFWYVRLVHALLPLMIIAEGALLLFLFVGIVVHTAPELAKEIKLISDSMPSVISYFSSTDVFRELANAATSYGDVINQSYEIRNILIKRISSLIGLISCVMTMFLALYRIVYLSENNIKIRTNTRSILLKIVTVTILFTVFLDSNFLMNEYLLESYVFIICMAIIIIFTGGCILREVIIPEIRYFKIILNPKKLFKLPSKFIKGMLKGGYWRKLFIIALVLYPTMAIVLIGIPATFCLFLGIPINSLNMQVASEIMMLIGGIIILLAFLVTFVVNSIIAFAHFITDTKWIINQGRQGKFDRGQSINRKDLAEEIEKLHSEQTRRKYLRKLALNEVFLIGEWPNGQRMVTGDDVFDRELSLLDCQDLSLSKLYSNNL